ncbi:MAG: hypothetical protein Edafosvirus32_6 [Edafosvirus sp.]|uniref:Uncharacterized protein n=1 Tax=Edafosvirus sp. TaxID=2487765 RepID=A0A3G4ZV52_9VIRU|nr:MAG: hypothetical protein Edafosvirus32_6 [Edafosvirus sp.]
MEQYYKDFVTNLKSFVSEIHNNVPTKGTKNFLSVFDKLVWAKVIHRYQTIMDKYCNELKNKDDKIFQKEFFIFPGIDMNIIWPKLTAEQRERIWIYLQLLYISSSFIMQIGTETNMTQDKELVVKTMKEDIVNKTEVVPFDPYVGVGTNMNANEVYGLDEMMSGPKVLPGETSSTASGIASLTQMFGIDKMINMDELSKQLKNMKKEDIDEATNNIKKLLSDNVDDDTSSVITNMLSNITDELKKDDVVNGDPLTNIVKIAESVAQKMVPQMEATNIDVKKLWSSTQNIAKKCKDNKGDSLFADGQNNPLTMLNSLVENQMNMMDKKNKGENVEINQEEMINSMLSNMGIDQKQFKAMQQNMQQGNMSGVGKMMKKVNKKNKNKNKKKPKK